MTNEEAIKNLKKLRSFHNGSYAPAIDKAIEALKEERPQGDLISREALKRYLMKKTKFLSNRDWLSLNLYDLIDNAPTVEIPVSLTEAEKIVCKAYLDDLDKIHSCNEYYLLMRLIDNAPTVNPCENCDLYFKAMTKEEMKKGDAE